MSYSFKTVPTATATIATRATAEKDVLITKAPQLIKPVLRTITTKAICTVAFDEKLHLNVHGPPGCIEARGSIWKLLIPITIGLWAFVGVICIFAIKTKDALYGRLRPEWYLEPSSDKRWKQILWIALAWSAVMVAWPVIMPVMWVRKAWWLVEHQKAQEERARYATTV